MGPRYYGVAVYIQDVRTIFCWHFHTYFTGKYWRATQ